NRRRGGHHDRAEAQHAGLEDRVVGAQAACAFGIDGEVDHHDGVLLDDADQQNDANGADDVELGVEQHQRQERADAGRGQGGEYRDRVDVALVEDTQQNVDGGDRGGDQDEFVAQRLGEQLRGA